MRGWFGGAAFWAVFSLGVGVAQTAPPEGAITGHPGWPQAKVADVDSVEHILGALYGVISGPGGQARDWDRLRSLCVPGARLIPVRVVPGTPDAKTKPATDVLLLTVDDYIGLVSKRFEADGFYEKSVHNDVLAFGQMVTVFSTYESRHQETEAKPFARGINSIQLLKDGGRYWIVDVYWDSERPETPIPAKYLAVAMGVTDAGRLAANFSGDWVGQLEYRDYGTDGRVFLPTWLTMEVVGDKQVRLKYTYDDGPTKVVREELLLALDAATKMATVGEGKDSSAYAVEGYEEFAKRNRGKLILTGKGTENGKAVDVRIEVSLGRNLFTWVKSTRAAGTTDEFKFRDGYTMTRAAAPEGTPVAR